jgi:serine/threonine protein kinase
MPASTDSAKAPSISPFPGLGPTSGSGPIGGSTGRISAVPLPKACPTCQARYPADFRVCPRDASPLNDAQDDGADPFLGATLGDAYQIVRIIGEGGMGRVYEARHTRLGRKRVAVKMLHAEYARQPDVVTRFQREAEAASGIAHPNVVDVYDVHHTEDGRPYLIGEFLEGEELGRHLSRVGRINVSLAVGIARQVCRALAAAHARGVVHRDMKPENVFLVGDPQRPIVKVIDFGISKTADATGTALTRTGMIIGTPSYMAPEQARGEKVDARADVYGVGGILYRALTGRKPFDAEDPSVTVAQVLTQDPPRPRSLVSSIPQALELVIPRAMAKEPRDRYASMGELEAELLPFDPDPPMIAVDTSGPSLLSGPGSDAVESGAQTMMVSGMPRSFGGPTGLMRATRDATLARPMLGIFTSVAYLWIVAGVIDALAGIVRSVRGTSNLTSAEAVLIVVGSVAATLTPLVVWVRRLSRGWGNSVQAIRLAESMRRVTMVAVATSGIGALLVRLFEVVVREQPGNIAWPMWSPILFAGSALGGLLAFWSLKFDARM